MLDKAKDLLGGSLHGSDGDMGHVKDFYFDDHFWTVRYLVVETGNWLNERKVLVSPYALQSAQHAPQARHELSTSLTKQQIKDSPSWDKEKPVSRQYEATYFDYYGWPNYWTGPYMWGNYPTIMREPQTFTAPEILESPSKNAHLRSMNEVTGYTIHAIDGDLGHVSDVILDDDSWAIRYFVVETGNWWPGKKVLITPQLISRVSWSEATVHVDLMQAAIERAPEYTGDESLNREYETSLYRHYDRPGYWSDVPLVGTSTR